MKIKMNEGKINHENNTIVCGKTFMKNASKYGTPEYNEFIGMKRDCPNYKVVVIEPKKAEAKMSMKGLTTKFMELYIIRHFGEGSQEYTDYLGMKNLCDDTKHSYMAMRNWFTTNYPDWDGKKAKRDEVKRKKDMEKHNQAELKINSLIQPAS